MVSFFLHLDFRHRLLSDHNHDQNVQYCIPPPSPPCTLTPLRPELHLQEPPHTHSHTQTCSFLPVAHSVRSHWVPCLCVFFILQGTLNETCWQQSLVELPSHDLFLTFPSSSFLFSPFLCADQIVRGSREAGEWK